MPIVILVILSLTAASLWLVERSSRPQTAGYLVTPEKYGLLSSRGAQVTDEKWNNRDGSQARGWLLRGSVGSPAVILLHKYGADRSYVLNLGVKLCEATNFTILMPDMRGHGDHPLVEISTFGGRESEDVLAAAEFLHGLKAGDQNLVAKNIGVYGIEMGALAALGAAAKDRTISAVALDSVPQDSNAVLGAAVGKRFPFASFVTSQLAAIGARMYYYDGSYDRSPACEQGKALSDRRVLLLAGFDAPDFQASTTKLNKCIQGSVNVETKFDMSPSGFSITSASIEQSEAYHQRVIDFFRLALTN